MKTHSKRRIRKKKNSVFFFIFVLELRSRPRSESLERNGGGGGGGGDDDEPTDTPDFLYVCILSVRHDLSIVSWMDQQIRATAERPSPWSAESAMQVPIAAALAAQD